MGAVRRYSDCQAEVARKLLASLPPAESAVPTHHRRVAGALDKPRECTSRDSNTRSPDMQRASNRKSPVSINESSCDGELASANGVNNRSISTNSKRMGSSSKVGSRDVFGQAAAPRKELDPVKARRRSSSDWSDGANPVGILDDIGDLYATNDDDAAGTVRENAQRRDSLPRVTGDTTAAIPRGGSAELPALTAQAPARPTGAPRQAGATSDARAGRRRSFDGQIDRLKNSAIGGGGGTGAVGSPVWAAECGDLYGSEEGDHVPITWHGDDEDVNAPAGGDGFTSASSVEALQAKARAPPPTGRGSAHANRASASRSAPRAQRGAVEQQEAAWLPPRAAKKPPRLEDEDEDGAGSDSGGSGGGGMVVRRHTVGVDGRERRAASTGRARTARSGIGMLDDVALRNNAQSTSRNAGVVAAMVAGEEEGEDDGEEGEWSSPERTLRRSTTVDSAARRRPAGGWKGKGGKKPPAPESGGSPSFGSVRAGAAHARTGSAGSVGHGGSLDWDVEDQRAPPPQAQAQRLWAEGGEGDQQWMQRQPPQCIKAALRARVVGRLGGNSASSASGAVGAACGRPFLPAGGALPPHVPPNWAAGPYPPSASATTSFIPPHLLPSCPSANSARSISAPPARPFAPPAAPGPGVQAEEDAQQLPPPPRLLRTLSSLSSSSARSSCSHVSTSSAPAGPVALSALRARAEAAGSKQRRGAGAGRPAGGAGEGAKESSGRGKPGPGSTRGKVSERVAVGNGVQRVDVLPHHHNLSAI
ncbi:unnamed protein product [Closterium sp. NIES-64]|nr:unnamed protein product [Closterium sp. NIES-64]